MKVGDPAAQSLGLGLEPVNLAIVPFRQVVDLVPSRAIGLLYPAIGACVGLGEILRGPASRAVELLGVQRRLTVQARIEFGDLRAQRHQFALELRTHRGNVGRGVAA